MQSHQYLPKTQKLESDQSFMVVGWNESARQQLLTQQVWCRHFQAHVALGLMTLAPLSSLPQQETWCAESISGWWIIFRCDSVEENTTSGASSHLVPLCLWVLLTSFVTLQVASVNVTESSRRSMCRLSVQSSDVLCLCKRLPLSMQGYECEGECDGMWVE